MTAPATLEGLIATLRARLPAVDARVVAGRTVLCLLELDPVTLELGSWDVVDGAFVPFLEDEPRLTEDEVVEAVANRLLGQVEDTRARFEALLDRLESAARDARRAAPRSRRPSPPVNRPTNTSWSFSLVSEEALWEALPKTHGLKVSTVAVKLGRQRSVVGRELRAMEKTGTAVRVPGPAGSAPRYIRGERPSPDLRSSPVDPNVERFRAKLVSGGMSPHTVRQYVSVARRVLKHGPTRDVDHLVRVVGSNRVSLAAIRALYVEVLDMPDVADALGEAVAHG